MSRGSLRRSCLESAAAWSSGACCATLTAGRPSQKCAPATISALNMFGSNRNIQSIYCKKCFYKLMYHLCRSGDGVHLGGVSGGGRVGSAKGPRRAVRVLLSKQYFLILSNALDAISEWQHHQNTQQRKILFNIFWVSPG